MPAQKTTREEMLIKAMQVFRRQGYHHSSMADLARACGVQKAHMYYYFDSKEDLMQAVLEAVLTYFEARIFALAYAVERPPAERMQAMTAKLRRVFLSDAGGCIMANTLLEVAHLRPEPAFLSVVRTFFDQLLAAFTALFGAVMSEPAAQAQAEASVQDMEGALMLAQLYGDPTYFDRALARAAACFSSDAAAPP